MSFVLAASAVASAETVIWNSSDTLATPLDSEPAVPSLPTEIFNGTVTIDENGIVSIAINTNFPEAGLGPGDILEIRDSYAKTGAMTLGPGDIYIAYAPDDVWLPQSLFALGMSNHSGNVVEQAYEGGAWDTVVKGGLYRTANDALTDFATGTYEPYEHVMTTFPDDAGNGIAEVGAKPIYYLADLGNDNHNTLPTVLRDYDETAGLLGMATVEWVPSDGTLGPGAYDILVSFDLADLGLDSAEDLYIGWTMECGNDFILFSPENIPTVIPEPSSLAIVSIAAILGIIRYRRRR